MVIIYIFCTTRTGLIFIFNWLLYIIYKLFTTVTRIICILDCLVPLYLVSVILTFPGIPTNMIHTTTFKAMIAIKYNFHLLAVTSLPTVMWITHIYIFKLYLKWSQFITKSFYYL